MTGKVQHRLVQHKNMFVLHASVLFYFLEMPLWKISFFDAIFIVTIRCHYFLSITFYIPVGNKFLYNVKLAAMQFLKYLVYL